MSRVRIINRSLHNHGATPKTFFRASHLRKRMTNSERLLWERLRKKKIKNKYFRRQHPYGEFILDFYCDEANMAIEIDGGIHEKMKRYDNERTDYLENTGLRIIRFTNSEVETNIDWVIGVISSYL